MRKKYKDILKRLELPVDTPETLTCKMCGGVLHQVAVNPYVCFWIHYPDEAEKCARANNVFHKPVIATSHNYTYNRIQELWNEKVESKNVSCATDKRPV
jgi:hypothetical protein